MFNRITSLLMSRPALFIVVYDNAEQTFSRLHPTAVSKAVEAQPWYWSPVRRTKSLLMPKKNKVTSIRSVIPFHAELRDDMGREYIFVSGTNFSFKNDLGYDVFDPQTDDLRLKFGEPDGQYAQVMIDYCLPRVLAKVA